MSRSTAGRTRANRPGNPSSGAHPVLVAGAAAAFVIPAFVFLAARLRIPGDGALLEFVPFRDLRLGLPIIVREGSARGLREGDRVVALAGQPPDRWIEMATRGRFPAPPPPDPLDYTLHRDGRTVQLRVALSRPRLSGLIEQDWSSYLFLGYMWAIGLIVFVLRPRQALAQATLILSSMLFGSGAIFFLSLRPSDLLYGWPVALWIWGALVLYGIFAAGTIHFALLFPVRQTLLERRPYLPLLAYLGVWPPLIAAIALRWNEAGSSAARLYLSVTATSLVSATAFPLSLLILLYGYRKEFDPRARRQVRWVLWAGVVAELPWQVLSVIPELLGYRAIIPQSVTSLLWLAFPTALAIAILREGLFDIDLIIHRTLVYGSLTLLLAAVYFASVAALQAGFRALAGQTSPLAVVLSTLSMAALFNPLRSRTQSAIDRRFYRGKYDAGQILYAFGNRIRDEVEISRLSASLMEAADQAMRPTTLSLWLRDAGEAFDRRRTSKTSSQ